MNRTELQRLALTRLRDAEALLNAGQWAGAYYLAGYAVECGLKACIARMTVAEDFPDKSRVLKSYSHNIQTLLEPAGLETVHLQHCKANPNFLENWLVAKQWDETARYSEWTEFEARELFDALSHPTDGVLSWISGLW